MDIRLGSDLGINIRLSSNLLMDIRFSFNLSMDIRLSSRVQVGIGYGGIIKSMVQTTIGNWGCSKSCSSGVAIDIGVGIGTSGIGSWEDGCLSRDGGHKG